MKQQGPLDFSKRSRRAIFMFVAFLVLVALIPRLIFLYKTPEKLNLSQEEFQQVQVAGVNWKEKKKQRIKGKKKRSYARPNQRFDPNTYAPSDWMQLGLSEKQAAVVVQMSTRGFYSTADVKRVFVIPDELFELIADSLIFPEKKQRQFESKKAVETANVQLVNLNQATEEQLMELKGIGSFFAKQIIKKREELGGFVHVDQLLEVWKFDAEKLEQVKTKLEIDTRNLRPLRINEMSAEEFKAHPYINWNVANSIVKMRTQLGGFQQMEDLKKSKLIDEELYQKLKPYLSLK